MCNCVCVFSLWKAPPAPHDVTVLEKSSDTIRLQWTYVDVTAGVTFRILYRPQAAAAADDDVDDAIQWMQSAEITPANEYTLTGLQPLTVYQLCVVALIGSHQTPHSDVIVCQTDQLHASLGI